MLPKQHCSREICLWQSNACPATGRPETREAHLRQRNGKPSIRAIVSGTNQPGANSFQTGLLDAPLLLQVERWAGKAVGPECVGIPRTAQFCFGLAKGGAECGCIFIVLASQPPK